MTKPYYAVKTERGWVGRFTLTENLSDDVPAAFASVFATHDEAAVFASQFAGVVADPRTGEQLDDVDDTTLTCERHGEQLAADVQTFTGFAGGQSDAYTLACGCVVLDEDDDVQAAK